MNTRPKPMTFAEVSTFLDLTRERISQLQTRAARLTELFTHEPLPKPSLAPGQTIHARFPGLQ
jgi:hypothetical protein